MYNRAYQASPEERLIIRLSSLLDVSPKRSDMHRFGLVVVVVVVV